MKLNKGAVLAGVAVLLLLAGTFWLGGNSPGLQGWAAAPATPTAGMPTTTPAVQTPAETPSNQPEQTPTPAVAPTPTPTPTPTVPAETPSVPPAETPSVPAMAINPETGRDRYFTEPVPAGKPTPVEPEDIAVSDTAYTCTLSVSCDTILDNLDWLDQDKTELVPEDGVIFAETTVTFYEGESVFNLLQREMKKGGIHMEFENTPIYNSAYIEGIANLYEFDCGELSGWMYRVNDWFPNYGSSRYQLQEGDKVEWVYTCDLGKDVGDTYLGRLQ